MIAHSSNNNAAPWALLWLGGLACASWVGLLMPEPSPRHQQSQAHSTQPLPTTAATRMTPLLQSRRDVASGWTHDAQPTAHLFRNSRATESTLQQLLASSSDPRPQLASESSTPPSAERLQGSVLLGGPLDLESLNEKPMVPAARIEQALRAKAADRLEALPTQWRPTMRAMLTGPERVLPAEVVRVPAHHLSAPEDYPMVVKSDGVAETPVTPSPSSKATLERWVERQQQMPMGEVKPVLVVLEPIASD